VWSFESARLEKPVRFDAFDDNSIATRTFGFIQRLVSQLHDALWRPADGRRRRAYTYTHRYLHCISSAGVLRLKLQVLDRFAKMLSCPQHMRKLDVVKNQGEFLPAIACRKV